MKKVFTAVVSINSFLVVALSLYLFASPVILVAGELRDPALRRGGTPAFLFDWHRALSADFEPWARQRVASGRAAQLNTQNISGTEWPVFSSVFYLWATEALQEAWEANPALSPAAPQAYAAGAIEAAAALVRDPNHAAWVRQHWGEGYLERENLFYRMLLIGGLTSYQGLTGNPQYQDLLRFQVDSLSAELDASAYGLLDDYPGQCYPIDILPAIAVIRRADAVLGTDHSAFAARALRAFEGERLDPETGLPAYIANPTTGKGFGPARGVGISYMLIWAPELWPETAADWYARYEQHFWQPGWLAAGFREISAQSKFAEAGVEDVDSGPVIAGLGTTASAFGIGAARVNGRGDQAFPLTAEALVVSWPLPDGSRLAARMLSNLSDAPFTGEAILLFTLTRQSLAGQAVAGQGDIPAIVSVGLGVYALAGLVCGGSGVDAALRGQKIAAQADFTGRQGQLILRGGLTLLGAGLAAFVNPLFGLLCLLIAQLFPRR